MNSNTSVLIPNPQSVVLNKSLKRENFSFKTIMKDKHMGIRMFKQVYKIIVH